MNTLKKFTIRTLIVVCFAFTVIQLLTILQILIVTANGYEKLNDDLELLRNVVTQYNVLPTDTVSHVPSTYENFVNEILRRSETDVYKYDIMVNSGTITNNTDVQTNGYRDSYSASTQDNPIKIYTNPSNPTGSAISTFLEAPNRGEVIYIELSMKIYVPVVSTFFATTDTYSQLWNRHLVEISSTTATIGNAHYKSK